MMTVIGNLVMSPTPLHAGRSGRLCDTDFTVCPAAFRDSDDWLIDPRDVELAVELISKSDKSRDIVQKCDWYAFTGVKTECR